MEITKIEVINNDGEYSVLIEVDSPELLNQKYKHDVKINKDTFPLYNY